MKRLLLYSGCCLILLSIACSPQNRVTVTDNNLGDSVEVLQNLIFEFSHELAPDSMLGKWDSSAYLAIEPAVKGMFKWNSKKQLIFSPAAGFKPATTYKVGLTTTLLKFSAGKLTLDATPLEFHTPSLMIEGLQTWWTLSPGTTEMLTLHASIHFNYEVDPSTLENMINADINGKTVHVTTGDQSVSKSLTINADGLERSDATNGIFTLRIGKGLKCTECGEEAQELIFKSKLNSLADLEVTSTETVFENGEGLIRIYTNQPVILTDIEKLIKLQPSPVFKIESMESGLLLRGGFTAGSTYTLTISKMMRGMLGGLLNNDYISTIPFGEQEPGIVFTNSKGMYLTSKGSRKIGLQIVNMPKIKVSVYKIFENNILAFMNNNRYSEWYGESEENTFEYNDYDLERFGNRILDQEYEVKDLPKQNGMSLLSMDFNDQMPFKGIYLISARSSENQWLKATKLVSVSDIGIIARTGMNEVSVFANSVKEANPLQNVTVSIVSSNNQVLFTGTTNGDGMVKFAGLNDKYKEFHPALITARSGNDFNYMLLSDTRVETSRFETGGYRENPSGYMAYVYGDREIYRPGETIHTNVIVRNRLWKPMKDMPVKLKLIMPNGRELTSQRKTLNKQGAVSMDFQLPGATVTGSYTLEVYTANDVLLTSKNLSVEEFMPDRITVKAEINKPLFQPGDSVQLNAVASNLFGTPAINRNYEVQFNLTKTLFQPKGFERYNFSIMGLNNITFPSNFKEGKTNGEGKFYETMYIDPIFRETGKLQGKAFVTVFDETGRPVNRVSSFDVETQNIYFGTRTSEYYAGVGQSMQLGIVALNGEGKPVSTTARVRIVKIDYHNVLNKSYGDRLYYVSQKEERILQDKQVTVTGKEVALPFTPGESGQYALRISKPGSDRYVEQEFYAYGWGYTASNAFAVNTEGTIDVTSDKESYSPGDKARLLFKTPFNGRLLITVEQNEVIKYFNLNTEKKAAELILPIGKEYLPNVYVTATLFRKSDDSSIPLTVAHGVIPVIVEEKNNKIPLSIVAVDKSKSNTKQQISIKTNPGSDVEVTIAVVDEGILQIRNTKTPDPYAYFYQKKALMVDAFDLYPYLLPELKMRKSSTGGDGYDLAKRVNPITNKRVKLIAAWSGILHTNAAGIASYTMDIPSFSGDLRIMAVAYKDDAFGSAEAHMKVADPIVISSALPRFTSPGDTVYVPVTFTNTTPKPISATVSTEASGSIRLTNAPVNKLNVNPGQEQRILYKITAPIGSGEGSFSVKVLNGSETYQDKTDISVRPAASLQVRNGDGSIKGGMTGNIDLRTGFLPNSADAQLIISKSPMTAFADQLKYLLDYPHGCAEQTISIAFPQIYYGDLAKAINNKPGITINVQTNVQAAITKILSLQHYNGGIFTWPGNNNTNNWTSVYAAHFLTEARKAGYEVNENGYNKLLEFLQKQVKEKKSEELWYWNTNNTMVNKMVPAKDIFYALYVLSLNNKADRSSMNYYRSKFSELAVDSKYLLACTYLSIGDRKTYDELLPKAFEGERSQNATGGSYYSYVRDMAMTLNALLISNPDDPQVGLLVRQLSNELKKRNWLNTQERALSFLALGKFSRQTAQSTITATITTDAGKSYNFDGKDLVLRKGLVNSTVEVKTSGTGNLYYFWNSHGLTGDGSFKQEDKNLKVRKTYYSRDGKEMSGNNFKQNDLVIIKITLENLSRSFIDNIVVTDMLPAGFEIENPRISTIPDLEWIKNEAPSDYIDMRDDRINIYTSLSAQPLNFYYVVRAVSPGNYVMGPVSADAMYSGDYHSIFGTGRVVVK